MCSSGDATGLEDHVGLANSMRDGWMMIVMMILTTWV
jgi:hypothetical protein